MKMRILLPLLGALLFARAWPAVPAVDSKEIQQILKEAIDNRRTVGIVVGIVHADGINIFSNGKTSRDGRNVDGDSVFEIGSVTKTFTATLLADMVKRGLAGLDDPVSKYLPDTVKVPLRGGREITLLALATQRSGLPRMPTNFKPADPENPYADYTVEKMYEFLSSYQLPRDIGEKYEYSNLGAGLLGHILARKAGQSYEVLLAERIFRPLEMNSTAIVLTPDMSSRLAAGHSAGLTPEKNWDLNALAGAGAIRSTVNDMMKYVASYMEMKPSPLSAAMEMARQDRNDTTGRDLRIGLCWHLLKRPDSVIVWHNGGTGGYHSFVGFDRKRGVGVVVLSNSTNDIDDIGFHLVDPQIPLAKFEARKERKEIAVDPGVLDAYAGEYRLAPNFVLAITKEGQKLFLQATGQTRLRLHPEAETEFFITEVDAQVSFVKESTGKVGHLILHQGGKDQRAERIK
ncbi:MAG: serine hydrolase [Candidatus Aminicenantes bacterium]|nr:serine hydrolase [Candidatus Aminicenantes bacterium]